MDKRDPLELVRQLKVWVDKTLSSVNEVPLGEVRTRYREVRKVIGQLDRLCIPVSEDIRKEKKTLEALISVSIEREKLASLSKELLSLARDINHQLKGVRNSGKTRGGKSPPKVMRVTFSDDVVIFEKTASTTFIRCLHYIGLERTAELRWIRSHGHPLVSTRRNESGGMVHEVDGYFIETKSSTKTKVTQLQRIARAFDFEIHVELLDV